MRSLFVIGLGLSLLVTGSALVEAAGRNAGTAQEAQQIAQGKGKPDKKNKGKAQQRGSDTRDDRHVGGIISAVERAIIGDYVRDARSSSQGLPPGLAKRDRLPPGLRKQIQRTGTLPPGLAKRQLPGDLRSRLPRRKGQDYRVVGDDIVLIATATNIILDVLRDVLR